MTQCMNIFVLREKSLRCTGKAVERGLCAGCLKLRAARVSSEVKAQMVEADATLRGTPTAAPNLRTDAVGVRGGKVTVSHRV